MSKEILDSLQDVEIVNVIKPNQTKLELFC